MCYSEKECTSDKIYLLYKCEDCKYSTVKIVNLILINMVNGVANIIVPVANKILIRTCLCVYKL